MNLSDLESVLSHDRAVRQHLDQLNRNQMVNLEGEIFAKLYWQKRNPEWFRDDNKRVFARLRWVQRLIKKRLAANRVKPELSEFGLEVTRYHAPGNIYSFENRHLRVDGWELKYQEEDYHGFWANRQTLQLCTYCEGDVVMKQANDKASFMREFIDTQEWYAEHA